MKFPLYKLRPEKPETRVEVMLPTIKVMPLEYIHTFSNMVSLVAILYWKPVKYVLVHFNNFELERVVIDVIRLVLKTVFCYRDDSIW